VSERPSATEVRETYFNRIYPNGQQDKVFTTGLFAVEASGYVRGWESGRFTPTDGVVAAIRADERERCRAELRAKVAEVERIARDDYGSALDELYDFAKEAFGGD
jgi:hypothetical protein